MLGLGYFYVARILGLGRPTRILHDATVPSPALSMSNDRTMRMSNYVFLQRNAGCMCIVLWPRESVIVTNKNNIRSVINHHFQYDRIGPKPSLVMPGVDCLPLEVHVCIIILGATT